MALSDQTPGVVSPGESRMNKLMMAILMSFVFLGCNEPLTVSKPELMEITKHWKEPKVAIWYYAGSDAEYHYFKFIDLNENKDYRVKREEMAIDATYPVTRDQKSWRVMPWGPASLQK